MSDTGQLLVGYRSVVFGGGRGIGRATALALGRAGSAVAVIDADAVRTNIVAEELRVLGCKALGLSADVRCADDVERIINETESGLGGIDVAVTVIGGMTAFAPFKSLHEYTNEEWELLLDINLGYVFRVVRSVVRIMMSQGGGSIVSIGSISGAVGAPHHGPYGAAKAGVVNLARSVAAEYGRMGIRMNVVAPGSIDTPAVAQGQTAEEYEAVAARIPLGRRGVPEEVADAVVFFASPLARYVTGQTLLVDGGLSVRYPHGVPNAHGSEAG